MKILPSTLRKKKRYIYFQVTSEEPIEYSDLEAALWNRMLDFLGEHGVSKTSVWLMKDLWNKDNQTGVISCNNKAVQEVIATLGLVDRLGDNRVTFKILKVSGTIRGTRKGKM